MPTLYESTREAIAAQLNAVEDVGKIFKSVRYVTDWGVFLDMYRNEEGLLKVCWFSKAGHDDLIDAPLSTVDAADFIHWTEKVERWRIEYFYGFKDDDFLPSEFDFEKVIERIEAKFRFLQNLSGVCYQSLPLQRTSSGLWSFQGGVLCHHAEWSLKIIHRIENPN